MLQRVVEFYLVVEVIHLSLLDVVAVEAWVVHLRQKESIGIRLFDVGVEVGPKLDWDHFGHVKAETIHSLAQPKLGDVLKLDPGIGYFFSFPKSVMRLDIKCGGFFRKGHKVLDPIWAHPIVDLDGFVPIVKIGLGETGTIAGPFGWKFIKLSIAQGMCRTAQGLVAIFGSRNLKSLARQVVEIVVLCVSQVGIVLRTKV